MLPTPPELGVWDHRPRPPRPPLTEPGLSNLPTSDASIRIGTRSCAQGPRKRRKPSCRVLAWVHTGLWRTRLGFGNMRGAAITAGLRGSTPRKRRRPPGRSAAHAYQFCDLPDRVQFRTCGGRDSQLFDPSGISVWMIHRAPSPPGTAMSVGKGSCPVVSPRSEPVNVSPPRGHSWSVGCVRRHLWSTRPVPGATRVHSPRSGSAHSNRSRHQAKKSAPAATAAG